MKIWHDGHFLHSRLAGTYIHDGRRYLFLSLLLVSPYSSDFGWVLLLGFHLRTHQHSPGVSWLVG